MRRSDQHDDAFVIHTTAYLLVVVRRLFANDTTLTTVPCAWQCTLQTAAVEHRSASAGMAPYSSFEELEASVPIAQLLPSAAFGRCAAHLPDGVDHLTGDELVRSMECALTVNYKTRVVLQCWALLMMRRHVDARHEKDALYDRLQPMAVSPQDRVRYRRGAMLLCHLLIERDVAEAQSLLDRYLVDFFFPWSAAVKDQDDTFYLEADVTRWVRRALDYRQQNYHRITSTEWLQLSRQSSASSPLQRTATASATRHPISSTALACHSVTMSTADCRQLSESLSSSSPDPAPAAANLDAVALSMSDEPDGVAQPEPDSEAQPVLQFRASPRSATAQPHISCESKSRSVVRAEVERPPAARLTGSKKVVHATTSRSSPASVVRRRKRQRALAAGDSSTDSAAAASVAHRELQTLKFAVQRWAKRLRTELLAAALVHDKAKIYQVAEALLSPPLQTAAELGALTQQSDEEMAVCEPSDECGSGDDVGVELSEAGQTTTEHSDADSEQEHPCPVCSESVNQVWNASCGHGCCGTCMLNHLLTRSRRCPHCREPILQVTDASGKQFQRYEWIAWKRTQLPTAEQ